MFVGDLPILNVPSLGTEQQTRPKGHRPSRPWPGTLSPFAKDGVVARHETQKTL